MFTHPQYKLPQVRISKPDAYSWFFTQAPCYWHGKVDLVFRDLRFVDLQPANSQKHWDVLARWTKQIACRRRIPPIVVSKTAFGSYYIHDGNHRYEAIRICYRGALKRLHFPVAVIEPRPGYAFEPVSFNSHWTYMLVPEKITSDLSVRAVAVEMAV